MAVTVNRGLSAAQVEEFRKHGVIRLGALLDDEELREAQQHFDALVADREGMGQHIRNLAARSLADEDQNAEVPYQVINMVQVWLHDPFFKSLLYKPELLDIVESVIGPNIQLYHDQAFSKPPKHGGPVLWHQDNGYWHCEPADLVSIWIALDDVDQENGCLWMLPGSHKLGTLPHDRSDSILLQVDVDESKLVPFEMPAGHGLMHHCEIIHGSHPNTSNRNRRAHAIHYMPVGTAIKDAMPMEGGLPLLRGALQQ